MRRHVIDTERTNGHGVVCTCGEMFANASLLIEHAARAEHDAGDGREARVTSREAGCCKRVTLPDGRYGFCILPSGHPVEEKCAAHVSGPPPASSFAPRRK